MESWVIIQDKITDKETPRVINGSKAQEALAIEFGTHFLRLINEEKTEAEVQIIRASLIDGAVVPVNGRYKIACYRRDDGRPVFRRGGRAKAEYGWNYKGITTKSIYALMMGRIMWLEEHKRNKEELTALKKAVKILENYLS